MEPSDRDSGKSGHDGVHATRAEASRRLRRALGGIANGKGSRSELEAAAESLVTAMRRAHEPPEQMLLQIKEILAEGGLRPTYATPTEADALPRSDASIYRDVIAWSIRAYYGNGDGDGDGLDGDGGA